jgi:hypothetical protein
MKSCSDPDHGSVGTRDQNLGSPVALVGIADALAVAMVVASAAAALGAAELGESVSAAAALVVRVVWDDFECPRPDVG